MELKELGAFVWTTTYIVWCVRREAAKVRSSLDGLQETAMQLKQALDAAIISLCGRLAPRLRSAMNVFEGASSLIQYDLTEEKYALVSEGYNAFATEFLPMLASITAPYQVRKNHRRVTVSPLSFSF